MKTADIDHQIGLIADKTIDMLRNEYEDIQPDRERWDWQPGVGLYGIMRAYDILQKPRYLEYCKHYVDRLIDLDQVQYSVNGSIVFDTVLRLYEITGEHLYRREMRYFLRWLLRSAARCQNDCFEHTWNDVKVNLAEQVWIDTLFMCGLVLADSYRKLGCEACKAEVIQQFAAHQSCLQDDDIGLFRHLYVTTTESHLAGAFWGRGNAWMATSMVDALDAIGTGEDNTADSVESLRRQAEAVAILQTPSGAFHTILDDPTTYLEMSATAGLGYGILKGVRLGLLDTALRETGVKAAQAILDNIQSDGVVANVSGGTLWQLVLCWMLVTGRVRLHHRRCCSIQFKTRLNFIHLTIKISKPTCDKI